MAELNVGQIFPEMDANALAGMDSGALSGEMAKLTAMKDAVNKQYKETMAPLQGALAEKLATEKAERDSDPEYKAKEQGIGK